MPPRTRTRASRRPAPVEVKGVASGGIWFGVGEQQHASPRSSEAAALRERRSIGPLPPATLDPVATVLERD